MSEEINKVVEEVVTESLPAPVKEFGEMSGDEKVQYIEEIRKQAGVAPEAETEVKSETARDEMGRFASTKEETPVNSDETSAVDDAGKKAETETVKPETEEATDWRNAEVRSLAEAYGIDDTKLAKIPSRDVLDILLDSLERVPEAKTPAPDKTVVQPAVKETTSKEAEEFSLNNNDELGADDAPKLVEKIREQDRVIRELREFQAQQMQAVSKQWADAAKSRVAESASKAFPDFYGEPGKTPTKEQAARIEELWKAHCDRAILVEKRGGSPNESIEFVKRSIADAHGDLILSEIDKKQERLNKLVAQSNRRTGGGSTKDLPTVGASPLEKNMAALSQRLRAVGYAGT